LLQSPFAATSNGCPDTALNMTIRAKVVGYFLVVFLLFVGVSGYIISRQRQANARLRSIHGFFLPLSRELASLQHNVHRPKRLHKKMDQIERLLLQGKAARVDRVDELLSLLSTVRKTLADIEAITEKEFFEDALERLRAEVRNIAQLVDELALRITGDAQSEGQQSIFIGLALSAILGCLGILTLLLSNSALKPLRDLIDSVRKIADGDFNQSLKVSTGANDELSILAREYNRALAALADRDIKIQKQQSEILQTERLAAVGQLSAEVVHEIRNPLNAISLNIDWLQHELQGTGQEIGQVLQSISREIERLHQITECYLVRARVPSREGQKAAVNEAIKEVVEFCSEEDKARSISVETLLTDEEFYITTDKSRFKQALLNILKNAKEAMPRGGRIQIRTEFQNNAYRIQVKDSGSGMNASTRHQSFHPFFTTKPNGTGLGLSVTKSIVEEAHGSIQCESRLGDGTTVTLQFPC
jgi:two-component system, NtrC family, sensor kinase